MRKNLFIQGIKATGISSMLMLLATPAWAVSMQEVFRNIAVNLGGLPPFLMTLSYIAGGVVFISGLFKAVAYTNQTPGGQPVPFYQVYTRLAAGVFFIALPWAMSLLIGTTGIQNQALQDTVLGAGGDPGAGLDGIFIRLAQAIYTPMRYLIPMVCYLIGIVYTLIGIGRLYKNPSDGPRGPAGRGTLVTFFTAAIMLAIGGSFDSMEATLFGSDTTVVHMVLSYTNGTSGVFDRINAFIPAMLMFLSVVGWIAFVRGFLILRNLAEGHQASMMAGITHIIGGVLAANMPMVLSAVQTTLGLSLIQT